MDLAGAPATVAYLQNKAALNAARVISVVDAPAHIAAHLDELNSDPRAFSGPLSADSTRLTLTLAQALNDTHALADFTSTVCIAATSSAGGIDTLTASQIEQLSLSGVTQLVATDHGVDLTSAQQQALGAVRLVIVQPCSGGSVEVIDISRAVCSATSATAGSSANPIQNTRSPTGRTVGPRTHRTATVRRRPGPTTRTVPIARLSTGGTAGRRERRSATNSPKPSMRISFAHLRSTRVRAVCFCDRDRSVRRITSFRHSH